MPPKPKHKPKSKKLDGGFPEDGGMGSGPTWLPPLPKSKPKRKPKPKTVSKPTAESSPLSLQEVILAIQETRHQLGKLTEHLNQLAWQLETRGIMESTKLHSGEDDLPF